MLVEPVSLNTLVIRGNTYAHLQEETPELCMESAYVLLIGY